MSSKVILLLGLFLAVALLVSSEVASARELAALDPSEESDGDAVSDAKYQGGGYGGNPRGGRGGGYSGGRGGGHGGNGGGHGGNGGGHGGNGGGHGGNGGGHGGNGGGHGGNGGGHGGNGGGHGGKGGGNGGGCRHGCCGQSYKGGCRCCTYAGEKADAETQN